MLYQIDRNGTITNMITSQFELEVKNVEHGSWIWHIIYAVMTYSSDLHGYATIEPTIELRPSESKTSLEEIVNNSSHVWWAHIYHRIL